MTGFIYLIENTVNGKVQVGQTTQLPNVRWNQYKYETKFRKDHLKNAMRKYGIDKFCFTVIEYNNTKEELDQSEIFWIAEMRRILGKENVYNIRDGGDTHETAEETKKKLSTALKGNKNGIGNSGPPKGMKNSGSFKEGFIPSNKGKKLFTDKNGKRTYI